MNAGPAVYRSERRNGSGDRIQTEHRVPWSVIVGLATLLLTNVASFSWFAATVNSQVNANTAAISTHQGEEAHGRAASRITALETAQENLVRSVDRILNRSDRTNLLLQRLVQQLDQE